MQKEPFVFPSNPADLLAAIRQNSEEALKALYLQNYPAVERYVLANNGSADEARDLYQEAFLAVWRNVQEDRFAASGTGSLGGYLFQVAKHKWLDHLRLARTRNEVPLPENGWEPPDEPAEEEAAYLAAVRTHFANLGDTCRDLLKRFYFEKQSLRRIAAAFNWTEATAKNNKYRCLQRLREQIK